MGDSAEELTMGAWTLGIFEQTGPTIDEEVVHHYIDAHLSLD
jgi:hypothetical protein